MASITITGSAVQINTVKSTFQSRVINYPNEVFTLVEESYDDNKVVLHGVTNSNYEENGLIFLEEFKKACLEVFQEKDLVQV